MIALTTSVGAFKSIRRLWTRIVHVPGLGTLTIGCLTGGDLEDLGGHADWALDAEVLGFGTVDELGADLLEGLNVARGESDADTVDLWALAEILLALVAVAAHFAGCDVFGNRF